MGVFQGLIAKLNEEELVALAKRANLGELGLQDQVDMLRLIRRELEAAEDLPYEEIPSAVRNEVLGQKFRTTLDDVLQRMFSYGPLSSTPGLDRNEITERLEGLRDLVIERVRPIVRLDRGATERLRAQAEDAFARAETQMEVLRREQENVRALAEEFSMQQASLAIASAETVSDDLSPHYRDQATNHADAARVFLIASVLVGVGFAISTWIALFGNPPSYEGKGSSEQWITFVRGTLGRLTLLSLFALALAFCLRNYRVNRHLEVVNKRRENALNTFGLLQRAVTKDEARNLVVAELVRAVFGSEETGYLSGQPDRTVIESPGGAGILSAMTASRGGASGP